MKTSLSHAARRRTAAPLAQRSCVSERSTFTCVQSPGLSFEPSSMCTTPSISGASAAERPTAPPAFTSSTNTLMDEVKAGGAVGRDRKSTRLNSSHSQISYAVFCLKKKKKKRKQTRPKLLRTHHLQKLDMSTIRSRICAISLASRVGPQQAHIDGSTFTDDSNSAE